MRMVTLRALVLTLLLFPFSASAVEMMTVYFDGFNFIADETPTTKEYLMTYPDEVWTITSRKNQERFMNILNTGEAAEFGKYTLRAVVVAENETYLVDAAGTVSSKGNPTIKISKGAFLKFRDSLKQEQVLWQEFHD